MNTSLKTVEVKLVDYLKYKETHGLYINGELQYRGTKQECMFFQLKLIEKQKQRAPEKLASA